MRKLFLVLLACVSLALLISLQGVLVKDEQNLVPEPVSHPNPVPQIDPNFSSSTEIRKIPDSVSLEVPLIAQKYLLSCEVASLQMVLAYKSIEVSQDDLIAMIGISEPKIRFKNESAEVVWGDPNEGFVGDVKGFMYHRTLGTISATGWGVNNGPIAKVAKSFRSESAAMTGNSVQDIIREISNDNPVIVWQHSGIPDSLDTLPTYKTLSGSTIRFIPSHVNLIVGFKKDSDGKYIFLVNDPEYGKLEIEQDKFDANWARFDRDMVVVR